MTTLKIFIQVCIMIRNGDIIASNVITDLTTVQPANHPSITSTRQTCFCPMPQEGSLSRTNIFDTRTRDRVNMSDDSGEVPDVVGVNLMRKWMREWPLLLVPGLVDGLLSWGVDDYPFAISVIVV